MLRASVWRKILPRPNHEAKVYHAAGAIQLRSAPQRATDPADQGS
jgi:hypothetical protein